MLAIRENSFSDVIPRLRRTLDAEATRQIKLLTSDNGNRLVTQQTLAFDEDTCLTLPLRSKEGVEDYRWVQPKRHTLRSDIWRVQLHA